MNDDGFADQTGFVAWCQGDVCIDIAVEWEKVSFGYRRGALRVRKEGFTDLALNGSLVMLPCLPAKSPTWQVAGLVLSHGGIAPLT